jgi:hypothetical protein
MAAAGLNAASFTFSGTSTTACGTGNTCAGTAVFNITGTDTFTITLTNDVTSIKDAGQLLTDVYFTLASTGTTLDSSNGNFINIASDGTTSSAGSGSTGWGFGSNNGVSGTWLLCIICGNGVSTPTGAQPSQGIVDNEAVYSNANPSIAGNGPHNPFLQSGATFSFSTDATLDTTGATNPFSDVMLSFGTTFGTEVPTGGGGGITGGSAPEPVSLILTGAGLMGLALLTKRRAVKA